MIHGFSNTQLGSLYNGIGPESFPGWLRAVIDFLHPSLEPVAFIHDIEWSLSDGTKESFTASNERFRRNGVKIAKAMYSFWNLRRYVVEADAAKFAKLCQKFGWAAWMAPFNAKDVEAQRMSAAVILASTKGAAEPKKSKGAKS